MSEAFPCVIRALSLGSRCYPWALLVTTLDLFLLRRGGVKGLGWGGSVRLAIGVGEYMGRWIGRWVDGEWVDG